MAKIIFIEPELRTDKLAPPYLSALLKAAGHHVELVMDLGNSEPEKRIAQIQPDFVMFSVATGNHNWYIDKNRALKRLYGYTSVFGGPHVTFYPDDAEADPDIDYVVRGPGEDVIRTIVEDRPRAKVLTGTVPDIAQLPMPDRSILYRYDRFGNARIKRFMACRDCQWSCTYCFNHLYHRIFKAQKGRFYQTRTPRQVVDEILDVRERWGLELAYFNDDDLARDHEWLTEFCILFKDEVDIEFCGSVRADSLTSDIVQMMAWAGCTFMNVALESAVPETQRMLRRGMVTNDIVRQACEWMAANSIKVRLQNMVGLPVDDPLEDALVTLAFNQSVPITDSWASIFMPYRNTDAWKQTLGMGLIDLQTDARRFHDDTVLMFDEDTQHSINNLARWWYYAHKWNMSRAAVLGLIDIPLAGEQKQLIQQARWREAARVLYGLE